MIGRRKFRLAEKGGREVQPESASELADTGTRGGLATSFGETAGEPGTDVIKPGIVSRDEMAAAAQGFVTSNQRG